MGAAGKINKHQEGETLHGFAIKRCEFIEELQLALIEAEHISSSAKVIYLQADDPENVFCLSFQTVPKSSNGIAHILEHAVLCGSKKYPIKDPFFSMTRRSLQTYMNALTGSDFTCYPAASCLQKDFFHLLDVYIDAVFFPNLDELSFKQEGHRLEFDNPLDPSSPLKYKGIVYNEMKGAMSSPHSRLRESLYKELFPDTTYGVNSGGDPEEIPSLTYEEFKAFHKTYYHPSRCIFYFYGDTPLETHLEYLQKRVLKDAKSLPPLEEVPRQKRFSSPKKSASSYPSQEEGENFLSFGFLTAEIEEQKELLTLELLDQILLDTDASPLKRALLESGIVPQISSYIESDILQAPFVITCAGISVEKADEIERLLFRSLKEIADRGIPRDLIENALHQLELEKSTIGGGNSPFGLELFWRSALPSHQGVDAARGLRFKSDIADIYEELKKTPRYFEERIYKYFLNNTHWVRLLLTPDSALTEKEEKQEKEKLEEIQKRLSEKEKKQLVKEAEALMVRQRADEEQADDLLPTLTLKDVPDEPKDYLLDEYPCKNATLYTHTCVTNGLCYLTLSLPLPHIARDELWLLRMLADFLPQIGTKNRRYTEVLKLMQEYTGGIFGNLSTYSEAQDPLIFSPHMQLKSRCLSKNTEKMFSLTKEILYEADFSDKERLEELIKKQHVQLKASLTSRSLRYALSLSQSAHLPSSCLQEEWFGLSYLKKLDTLVENLPKELENLQSKLKGIHQTILSAKTDVVVTAEEALLPLLQKETSSFPVPKEGYSPFTLKLTLPSPYFHYYDNASPVSFAAKAVMTVPYTDEKSASFTLVSHLLQNLYLHRAIREEGGAYGGGAQISSLSGKFHFYSYRDPCLYETLQNFDNSLRFLVEEGFSEKDLTEAKLEVYQSLDDPLAPEEKAATSYFWKNCRITYALRQKWRQELKKVTKEQVLECCKKLQESKSYSTCVFAGKALVEKENTLREKKNLPILKPLPI